MRHPPSSGYVRIVDQLMATECLSNQNYTHTQKIKIHSLYYNDE